MDSPLMVTISGIRGIVGKSLFPHTITKYISAFATLQSKKKNINSNVIILGMDSRISGPWVRKICHGVLSAFGFEIWDIGIVPTPTVQFMVKEESALGGIIITSSHNPVEWNGLKFVDSDSLFLSPEENEKMFEIANKEAYELPNYDVIGKVIEKNDAATIHIEKILNLHYIHKEEVQKKQYKVVLDTINGAGGPLMLQLLTEFGCKVIGLNLETTGLFSRAPEPIPENLGEICQKVKDEKADFGIAVDPDVDRCVFIDETGSPLGEEYTLAIAFEFMLGHVSKEKHNVVKNLSSSKALDDIAKKYGSTMFSTPVGEIQVGKKMQEVSAFIGGEGNGGVMLPDLHIGRDAPVAAALALQMLTIHGGKISELKKSLPQYEIVKLKANIEGINPDEVIQYFKNEYQNKDKFILNDLDGLRIDCDEEKYWVHLRKSNTEPIIRVIGEGRDLNHAKDICGQFLAKIQTFKK